MTEDRFISMKELKEHVLLEELSPGDLFTEEQLRADPVVRGYVEEKAKIERQKEEEEEDDMIPDVKDIPEKKDDSGNDNGDDEDSLIPD